MGADYSIELISIETYAPQFIGHNKIFLGSVRCIVIGWTIRMRSELCWTVVLLYDGTKEGN